MNATVAAETERLSPAEKLLLVAELQDHIANESNALAPSAWHDTALADDARDHAFDRSRGDSWADVKRRITGQG